MANVRAAAPLFLACALALTGCLHHRHGHKHVRETPLPPARITTIGVNSWLWRASLDVLSFMPIAQTDSNGGVIVTDWYQNPRAPGERVKVTVSILGPDLRADALRVAVARQTGSAGAWADAAVSASTVQKLEETILTRARDLRRAASAS